jgi:hypothetical protein
VAGGAILQWTEYYPCYSWRNDESENLSEKGADRNPLMSNLRRMVTIQRKLDMDQLQCHIMSELHLKQETNNIN